MVLDSVVAESSKRNCAKAIDELAPQGVDAWKTAAGIKAGLHATVDADLGRMIGVSRSYMIMPGSMTSSISMDGFHIFAGSVSEA